MDHIFKITIDDEMHTKILLAIVDKFDDGSGVSAVPFNEILLYGLNNDLIKDIEYIHESNELT